MDLECGNCDYQWDYQGNSDYYASCPRCKASVKIPDTQGDAQ